MVRDDPSMAVPSFFRCPISLDVMSSPVSLSTGVTYDRPSIQRWLDAGNTTCPATMQALSSSALIPNLTLHRLIAQLHRPLPPSPDSPLSPDRVLSLAATISGSNFISGGALADALSEISRFGMESENNRRFLAKIDGFLADLLNLLRIAGNGAAAKRLELDSLEMIAIVAEMVLSRVENRHCLSFNLDSLKILSFLIQTGSVTSKIAAVKIIELLSINAEKKLAIAATDGILIQLLSLLSPDTHQALIESSLSCLISISKPKCVKVALLRLQSIRKLSKLLGASTSTVPVIEKSLKLLELVSSNAEGRSALCDDAQCVGLILQRSLKVSSEAMERAVTILWSLCYLFGDEQACNAVSRGNGLARILVVMQSNCSPTVRQMSGDLVKLFGSSSKHGFSGYDTKTTHIMPF